MKTKIRIVTVLTLAALAAVFAQGPLTPPPGAPAPTMKTLDQLEPRIPIGGNTTPGDANAVFVIASPGTYYLQSTIMVPGGKSIAINASNVTLDLSGARIEGAASSLHGIVVTGSQSGIDIFNGTMGTCGGYGVNAAGARSSRLSKLRAAQNAGGGFRTGAQCAISDCTAEFSANGPGITTGEACVVTGCIVASCTTGILAAEHNVITNCTSSNNNGGAPPSGVRYRFGQQPLPLHSVRQCRRWLSRRGWQHAERLHSQPEPRRIRHRCGCRFDSHTLRGARQHGDQRDLV
jgi:hypothetical protein